MLNNSTLNPKNNRPLLLNYKKAGLESFKEYSNKHLQINSKINTNKEIDSNLELLMKTIKISVEKHIPKVNPFKQKCNLPLINEASRKIREAITNFENSSWGRGDLLASV